VRLLLVACLALPVLAEEDVTGRLHYGPDGLEYLSNSKNFRIVGTLRLQFRLSYPFDSAPSQPDDVDKNKGWDADLRRARARIRGHMIRPWVKYMVQYDLRDFFLRDCRLTVAKVSWLQSRIGLFKVNYNRERVASSGAQQFAERSIVNRVFTVDRQIGLTLRGRTEPAHGSTAQWTLGVFNGTGRNESNDDDAPLLTGKLQWNFLGRAPGVTMGDPEYHEKAAGALALAFAWNRSPYTRFGTSEGGSQLVGFEPGEAGQYTIPQAMFEWSYKCRGLSTQGELHWKRIDDNVNGTRTDLAGGYAQVGYFFHGAWDWFPKPLELATRLALVDDDLDVAGNNRWEANLNANWFFHEHRNKLTATLSYLALEDPDGATRSSWRIQLQWDVTF
jgi:hypothetical protein